MVIAPEKKQEREPARASHVWKWVAIALFVFVAIGASGAAVLIFGESDESADPSAVADRSLAGSGVVVSETRTLPAFDGLDVVGEADVVVRSAAEQSVVLRVDDNLLPVVTTEVRGSTLFIDTVETVRDIAPTEGLRFEIGLPRIESVAITGAGSITVESAVVDEFRISLTGAGLIDVESLDAGELRVSALGAGSIEVAGEVATQDVTTTGVVAYRAADLRSAEADIESISVESVVVWVTDSLHVRLLGVGSVEYYGNPANVTSEILGVGAFRSLGAK